MTQEEKVKAYDEALERAKKLCEESPMNRGILKDIFPELVEDENGKKIPKWFKGGCYVKAFGSEAHAERCEVFLYEPLKRIL